MNDAPRLVIREAVLVEDWVGEDGPARQAHGLPPDLYRRSIHWYENGFEIVDPALIRELEEKHVALSQSRS